MTDQEYLMLEELKSIIKLELDSDIGAVGWFPDNVSQIGNKYPACMICDGDEEFLLGTGTRIENSIFVEAYIYDNKVVDRIKKILSFQRKIIDACQKDLTVGGKAILIEALTVEKGEYEEKLDMYLPGFYPNLTVRKITFRVLLYDTRSQ